MRKRLLLAAGTMAGLVGVVLVVLTMLPPNTGVTKANFDRIKDGMTMNEVELIFGEESKWSTGRIGGSIIEIWESADGASACVRFREDVASKTWTPSSETIPDKIRRWLHIPPSAIRPIPAPIELDTVPAKRPG